MFKLVQNKYMIYQTACQTGSQLSFRQPVKFMISTKMRTYSQTSEYNCQNTNILFDTQEVPEFKIHWSKFNILLTDPYWYLCNQ